MKLKSMLLALALVGSTSFLLANDEEETKADVAVETQVEEAAAEQVES